MEKKEIKRHYKPKVIWCPAAEELLIESWGRNIGEIRKPGRHAHIFEDMAEELKNQNFKFTPTDIKTKLHNLSNKYRREKRLLGSFSQWPLYRKVAVVIGGFQITDFETEIKENIVQSSNENETLPKSPPSPTPATTSKAVAHSAHKRKAPPSPTPSSLVEAYAPPSPSSSLISETIAPKSHRRSKKRRLNLQQEFQEKMLKMFEDLSRQMLAQNKKADQQMEELIELEKTKIAILHSRQSTSERLANGILNYLETLKTSS